eukprot:CFRG0291T1
MSANSNAGQWNRQSRTAASELMRSEANELIVTMKYLIAGGVAGGVSRTVVAPFERAKILIQVSTGSRTGIVETIQRIYQADGISGLFRGNGVNILRMIPYTAIQISAYENYKQMFTFYEYEEHEMTSSLRLACGALAGVTAAVITYPLDIIRTRMSLHNSAGTTGISGGAGSGSITTTTQYTSMYDCCRKIMAEKKAGVAINGNHLHAVKLNGDIGSGVGVSIRESGGGVGVLKRVEGIKMLFRGVSPTVLGVMPYVALNFALYETLKSSAGAATGTDPHEELEVSMRLACAAIAGAMSQTVTYPLDVVKKRMQVMEMHNSRYHYRGTFDAFKCILRSESWRGLYRGLVANYLKVVPSVTASYFTYEHCKKYLLL